MPDISMCRDHGCPSRETCRRYTATPTSHKQAYASFDRGPEAEKCGFYWPTTKQTEKENPHAE